MGSSPISRSIFQKDTGTFLDSSVGIARGKQDAIELASSIVVDMYNTNGNFDIRAFLNFYEDTFSGKEVL